MLSAILGVLLWLQLPAPLRTSGVKATVLFFVSTDCPITNRYAPEVQRIYAEFAPRGVDFWLVYPDPDTTPEAIRKHVAEYKFPGRTRRDPDHRLVRLAEARVTPEAAVFAPDGRLVYHGRIDDRYVDFGKARPAPTQHDLKDALDAVLAGKPVRVKAIRAVGCFIPELSGVNKDSVSTATSTGEMK